MAKTSRLDRLTEGSKETRLLRWAHFLGPGFVILLAALTFGAAFIIQLLATIGLPKLEAIYHFAYQFKTSKQITKFGIWTICTNSYYSSYSMSNSGQTCQKNSLGYSTPQYSDISDLLILPGLGKALIVQPIATGLAGLAVPALLIHISSNLVLWPMICAAASAFSVLAFVFEIIVFGTARTRVNSASVQAEIGATNGLAYASLGPAVWIQLAAMAAVCFATFIDWIAYIRRKVRATHKAKFGRSNAHIKVKEDDLWTSDIDPKAKGSRGKVNLTDLRSQAVGFTSSRIAAGGVLGRRLRARVMGTSYGGPQDEQVALKNMGAPHADEKRYSKRHIPRFGEPLAGEEDARELGSVSTSRRGAGSSRPVSGPVNRGPSALSKRTKHRSAPMGEYVAGAAAGAGIISYSSRKNKGSEDGESKDRRRPKSGLESRRHMRRDSQNSEGQEEWHSDEGDDVLFDRDAEDPADLNYLLGARRRSEPSEPSEAGTRLEQRKAGRSRRVVSEGVAAGALGAAAGAAAGGRRRSSSRRGSSAQESEGSLDAAPAARSSRRRRSSSRGLSTGDDSSAGGSGADLGASSKRRSKRASASATPERMSRSATESPTEGRSSSRRHTARSRGYQLDAADSDPLVSPRTAAAPEPRYSSNTSRRGVSASPTPSTRASRRAGSDSSAMSQSASESGIGGATGSASRRRVRDPDRPSSRSRRHSNPTYASDDAAGSVGSTRLQNRRNDRASSSSRVRHSYHPGGGSGTDPFAGGGDGDSESMGTTTSMMRDRDPLTNYGDEDNRRNSELVSPRRGKRAARYSARMAEDF